MTQPVGFPRLLTRRQGFRLVAIGAVITLIGAALWVGLVALAPTTYDARTNVQYHLRRENATHFLRTDLNLDSQEVVLTSAAVLGPVAAANGLTLGQLTDKVSVTNVDNSEIFQIDVLDPNRATGVALADAIVKQYLIVAATSGEAGVVQRAIDDARAALSTASPADAPAAQTRVDNLGDQLNKARLSGNTAEILTPAYSLAAPDSPDLLHGLRLGALAGFLVAAVVTTVLARRWTRPLPSARPPPNRTPSRV